jgi:tetratricopeptide (TPR) repeat protein
VRLRHWLLSASLAFLTACARMPGPPGPPAAPADDSLAKTVAKHRQLAVQYQQAGDLAAAAAHWQVVSLLAPDDEGYRRELAGTRAAMAQISKDQLAAGLAAMRNGDSERATQAMLRVLAVDPDNAQASRALRDLEKQKLASIQAQRAARVRQEDAMGASGPPRTASRQRANEAGETYDLEQRLEMFKGGDVSGGLRELRRFVDANPADRAARQRIGAVVYERGQLLEKEGAREQALALFEQAAQLRGDPAPGWEAHVQALRAELGNEYYEKGMRCYRSDVPLAIRQWETSLRYDPKNLKSATRLQEARQVQNKLKSIPAPGN